MNREALLREIETLRGRLCDGRLILLLEYGYHVEANAEALHLVIRGIREHDGNGQPA